MTRNRYKWYRHCIALAVVLQKVADGDIKRLMVFMPPRHGKSEEISRLFSAYYLYRFPHKWVGVNSYGQDLANNLSRAARDNYKAAGGETKSDADAVKQWETGKGGGLWAAGVGGPITGKGFHLGIIDDPVKNHDEASSTTIQKRNKEWYNSTFYTREEPDEDDNPDGAIIIIQTRWHENDLSGWLLGEEKSEDEEPERWHIVSYPAIKEEKEPDFPSTCTVEPDWREVGEPLCPERRPLEKLKRIWKRIGDYFWSALFQQTPIPASGAFFQDSWFQIENVHPRRFKRLVRYWDISGAEPNKGDWTVGVLMGEAYPDDGGKFWILHVERFQRPSDERNKAIKHRTELDKQEWKPLGQLKSYVEQPPGLGKEAVDTIIRLLAGYSVEAHPVGKDKTTRAEPFQAQARAGNVRMMRDEKWNIPYLKIMGMFPYGKNDDDVDGTSGAFNKLAAKGGASFSQDYTKQ